MFLHLIHNIKKFFRGFRKSKIKMVHEKDLEDVLGSFGVLGKVQEGMAVCSSCGILISLDNLEAVFKESGEIKFICSKTDCTTKL